ncbi:hypothetical protein [Pseudoalteromonas sp. SR41-1]|uniref:hypothetical protein n=1 Tax=Pseudoalteromonas sp. SR41-1 TaxID=2760952 RepID=UPI001600F981|nr:hypothetical protein [Pseudoalteromonas sp. SR41-1]MBB1280730.1 hypothetical protein [Pseudoalteromonas sp. SR41-1]
MRGKIKDFWNRKKFILITFSALAVTFIGVYEILYHSNRHYDVWSDLGSWVGGVGTIYAVFIAIIEYRSRKRVDGAYERFEILSCVKGEYFHSWMYCTLYQLETKSCLESLRSSSRDKQDIAMEKWSSSLKSTLEFHQKFTISHNKLSNLVTRLRFLSPDKHKILKGDFENLYKLANDVEKLMDTIDRKRFDKIDPNWSSELNDLSNKISKKNNYDLIFNIQYDEEWSEYLEGIRENVFNSLLKKLENPEL